MAKKAKKFKKPAKTKKLKKAKKAVKPKKAKKAAKAVKPKKAKTVKRVRKFKPSPKLIFTTKKMQLAAGGEAPLAGSSSKVKKEPALTDSQINKFREVLSQKREELFSVVQRKKEQEIQDVEPDTGDEADVATRSVEKEMLFELTDSEKQTLDMIEAALRKIEKGVYGLCESCRRNISRGRMEVMPWARYCIYCQTENEFPPTEPFPA
ncbi:MAG: TraR/DksA family transcriptional regulator [Elusimicrobiota bacterium]|jgi:DnaK suppressor protein